MSPPGSRRLASARPALAPKREPMLARTLRGCYDAHEPSRIPPEYASRNRTGSVTQPPDLRNNPQDSGTEWGMGTGRRDPVRRRVRGFLPAPGAGSWHHLAYVYDDVEHPDRRHPLPAGRARRSTRSRISALASSARSLLARISSGGSTRMPRITGFSDTICGTRSRTRSITTLPECGFRAHTP